MNSNDLKNNFPSMPDSFSKQVQNTLYSLPAQKVAPAHRLWSRRIVIAMAAIVVLSMGTIAVGRMTSLVSFSNHTPTFTSVPSTSELQNSLSYLPKVPAELSGGYLFTDAHVSSTSAQDASGNTLWSGKKIYATYSKGGQSLMLSSIPAVAVDDSNRSSASTLMEQHSGIDLYYNTHSSKTVPDDYVLNEQDLADQESGKYIFNVGSEEITIDQIQSVTWIQDDVSYTLLAINSSETQESLLAIAKTIVDA